MAVKTYFTSEDFEAILSQYDSGEYIRFDPFENGNDQTNLLLITTAGSAVVKYYEKRTLDYVKFEVELLRYLAQNSYPCSSPVVNRQGEYVSLYKNKPLAFFEFLEGKHSAVPENCLQVAKVIGQLHTFTIGYKPGNAEHRAAYDLNYCWHSAKESAKSIKSDAKAQERLTWVKSELNKLELPDNLPKGVCHGDVNPTNFLYLHRKLSAVLDFDQASYTWLLYDVAQLVYWWGWSNKGDLNSDTAKKLIAAYEKMRPMTAEEHEHLFDELKLVILIGISWFLADDAGYLNARRKIEALNATGRNSWLA